MISQTIIHFGVFDYVLIGIVLLSVIVSFFRGFLREAISLATWFFAFYLSIRFSPIVDNALRSLISHNTTRYIISIVAVFIVVLMIGMLINKMARSIVTTTGLGLFDKILGAVFGIARGFLFVIIILLVITESSYQDSAWFKQSMMAPYFKQPVAYFINLLPKDVKSVSSWIDRLSSMRERYHHPLSQ